MIRGVIREFTGTATGTGGASLAKGRKSQTTKAAQSDYDTKSAEYDTAVGNVDGSKRYRKITLGKGGGTQYSPVAVRGGGWSTNPDWSAQVADRDAAERAKDSAETTLDRAEADDLQKQTPTQKPPSGGGAGFGKGKSAGKGKGKKKKN